MGSDWVLQALRDRRLTEHRGWEVEMEGFFKNREGSGLHDEPVGTGAEE